MSTMNLNTMTLEQLEAMVAKMKAEKTQTPETTTPTPTPEKKEKTTTTPEKKEKTTQEETQQFSEIKVGSTFKILTKTSRAFGKSAQKVSDTHAVIEGQTQKKPMPQNLLCGSVLVLEYATEETPKEPEKTEEVEIETDEEKINECLRTLHRATIVNTNIGSLPSDISRASLRACVVHGYVSVYSSPSQEDGKPDKFRWNDAGKEKVQSLLKVKEEKKETTQEEVKQYTRTQLEKMKTEKPNRYKKLLDEKGNVKSIHIKETKKEVAEKDAAAGQSYVATINEPSPWMADTVAAKICRLADREVLSIRDTIGRGNFLARCGIDPSEVTPAVITEAERLERLWKADVNNLIARYNNLASQINEARGYKVDKAPEMTPTPEKKEKKTPEKKEKTTTTPEKKKGKDTPTPEKKEKKGKAMKYPVDFGGSGSHSITSVLRWLGERGYSEEDGQKCCDFFELDTSPATIKTQIYRGSVGGIQPAAELTEDEAEVLEAIIAGKE